MTKGMQIDRAIMAHLVERILIGGSPQAGEIIHHLYVTHSGDKGPDSWTLHKRIIQAGHIRSANEFVAKTGRAWQEALNWPGVEEFLADLKGELVQRYS